MNNAAKLEAVYAQIQKIACKGLCFDACGPIVMSGVEYARLGEPVFTTLRCPVLGPDNRCTKYEVRPTICRLWGVAEGTQCPHGCEIEGGQKIDGQVILTQIKAISPSLKPNIVKMMNQAAESLRNLGEK
jgi:hypothetical protein